MTQGGELVTARQQYSQCEDAHLRKTSVASRDTMKPFITTQTRHVTLTEWLGEE